MYTKLFGKILDSSIWNEPDSTRIVWITLLAAMDEEGYAHFSAIENLARRAVVSLENAQKAVLTLESPDPNSHDKDNEGRRIERVDGGWIVLNAEKHRSLATREAAKEWNRNRIREFRQRKRKEAKEKEIPTESGAHTYTERNGLYEQRTDINVTGRYTPVTEPYKGVQTSARTEVDIACLRAIGFRRSTAASVEHEYAAVLEAGADPKEVIKACQRIYEWTEKGKYARDLADTIRRWQEPEHLWRRKSEKSEPSTARDGFGRLME